MKRHRRLNRPVPMVPTASLADIAFLLIIFFMLTTSFSPDRTSVALPSSERRADVDQKPAIVAITPDGTVVFSDGVRTSKPVVNMDDLQQQAEAVVIEVPDKEFVIKADRSVRYRHVDAVLEALRQAGVRKIGLLTNQSISQGTP
ncbi:MAG: biopolymer transporter ExbD [Acidobacteriota bacterium]